MVRLRRPRHALLGLLLRAVHVQGIPVLVSCLEYLVVAVAIDFVVLVRGGEVVGQTMGVVKGVAGVVVVLSDLPLAPVLQRKSIFLLARGGFGSLAELLLDRAAVAELPPARPHRQLDVVRGHLLLVHRQVPVPRRLVQRVGVIERGAASCAKVCKGIRLLHATPRAVILLLGRRVTEAEGPGAARRRLEYPPPRIQRVDRGEHAARGFRPHGHRLVHLFALLRSLGLGEEVPRLGEERSLGVRGDGLVLEADAAG